MDHRNPRHVYRALLRAISYLPDSTARAYLGGHVKGRFASHAKATPPAQITKNRLRTAEKATRCLERAGRGDIDELEKVLDFAYGRRGARRRLLLRGLLQQEPPKDDVALAEIISARSLQAGKKQPAQIEQMKPTPKFTAFLKSQIQNFPNTTRLSKSRVRTMTAPIPKTNIWGRPMPLRRQRSIRQRWWAETLGKVYPPIPMNEFNHLRDLVQSVHSIEPLIPRRKPQKPRNVDPEEAFQEQNRMVLQYLMDPARAKGIMSFDPDRGLVVGEEDNAGNGRGSFVQPHNYRRTMRRLYNRLWSTTSTMYNDASTGEWVVNWGRPSSSFHSGIPSTLPEGEALSTQKTKIHR